MTIVHMIGNAHIDPVWLWPWQAGVDEALATVCSAADRCEEYPEFIFTRGEAWIYRQIEQLDPELFGRVKRLVACGQWHITGGQWIQPDVNLPTYEGLRRQFVHGRRYFESRFGVCPDVAYNVDSFGHPATLPDLLTAEGYIGYVFHRPNQQQTPVPHATFRWRGAGGGEVLGFRIPAPYTTRADDLYGQIMLSLDAADPALGHIMCFYGVGNHGGGPTKGNIEYILAHRRAFPGAELRFSTPQAFFQAVQAKREVLPVVDCELQRTFPGCYVVMQDIKCAQRRGEHLLQQTQAAVDALAPVNEREALTQRVDTAWEDLLFTQFHDILAGTSIEPAWESVRAMQGRARITAEETLYRVTRLAARRLLPPVNHQQIAMVNPGPDAFEGYIEHEPFLDFDAWGDRWLADAEGNAIPFQFVQPHSTIMLTPALVFPAKIPPGGATAIIVRDDPPPTRPHIASQVTVTPERVSNGFVFLDLGPTGINQMSVGGRSLFSAEGFRLHLREDGADTWGFHIDRFDGPVTSRLDGLHWVVEEAGPLRGRVRAESTLGRSVLRLTLTVYAATPCVDLRLDCTFAEHYRLLQMSLGLSDHIPTWRCGLAGGEVVRAASPVEWPVQGWASVGNNGAGLAVLTHDAYSASLSGSNLTWSLLRATRMAWSGGEGTLYGGRDVFTDQGSHRIDLRLWPWSGDAPADAELHSAACALLQRPIVFDRYEGLDRPPWKNAPPRRLWTPAEHRARRDGRMAHLTDTGGGAVEEG
jgi:alpha-mannosidase